MKTLVLVLGIALAIYLVLVIALVMLGRRTQARELTLLIPNFVLLFKDLIRDPRVPRGTKWLLVVGAAWVASPIDLIPEFIPFLGPLDDVVVVALILRRLGRKAGREVIEEHWRGDPATIARVLGTVGSPGSA